MTKWFKPQSIPKDRGVLVWGKPTSVDGDNPVSFRTEGVHLAYYDEIDDAFCIYGAGWLGPFIEPLAWAEAPQGPSNLEILNGKPLPEDY